MPIKSRMVNRFHYVPMSLSFFLVGANADGVLGQPSFAAGSNTASQSIIEQATAVTGMNGDLFVADFVADR